METVSFDCFCFLHNAWLSQPLKTHGKPRDFNILLFNVYIRVICVSLVWNAVDHREFGYSLFWVQGRIAQANYIFRMTVSMSQGLGIIVCSCCTKGGRRFSSHLVRVPSATTNGQLPKWSAKATFTLLLISLQIQVLCFLIFDTS